MADSKSLIVARAVRDEIADALGLNLAQSFPDERLARIVVEALAALKQQRADATEPPGWIT